jgi:alpha-tubulin suppressor-like RCC1 family protein
MKNRLACGLNHSVFIGHDEKVYVWGRSIKDELGVPEIKDSVQNTPYVLEIQPGRSVYKPLSVSCGDSHTALLLRDDTLPKLKLVYSPVTDISKIFKKIRTKVDQKELERIHKEDWKSKEKLKKKQIEEFFKKYYEGDQSEVTDLIGLLMKNTKKDKILYKEFRDQIFGVRLDDGIVLTWGNEENGRLGRDPKSESRFVDFRQQVSITNIACGGSHTLAISDGRKLYSWGGNAYGQLGTGNTESHDRPQLLSIEVEYLRDISAGGSHSMALSNDGEVFTWGLGEGGRLGHGGTNIELYPRKIEDVNEVRSIVAGHSHSGFIKKGEIYTWGIGTYGRLGHGNLNSVFVPTLVEHFRGRFMDKLCLSFFHSVVLSSNGEVWAWGNSKNGRLGVATSYGENQLIPVRVGINSLMGESKIIDIACGYKHGLALAKSGQVFAWGCGVDGKLGLGNILSEEQLPKEIKFPKSNKLVQNKKQKKIPLKSTEIISISCSYFNTYCLSNSGEFLCWGGNSTGQCGVPSSDDSEMITEETPIPYECKSINQKFVPIPITLDAFKMEKIKKIASNGEFCAVVNNNGEVYVWGSNEQGQLGTGFSPSLPFNDSPSLLTTFKRTPIKAVSCGPYHTAFLAKNGELYLCGSSENGKLGLGDTVMNSQSPYQYIPRILFGLPNIKRVACGVSHTIAIDYSYDLWSWGSGWFGKLGHGDTADRISPFKINLKTFYPNLNSKIKEIACGEYHTLLLTASGDVYTAGLSKYAGLSVEESAEILYFNKMTQVNQIKHIAVGRDHSIVVTQRGQLYGWGKNNHGKLGIPHGIGEILECQQILIDEDENSTKSMRDKKTHTQKGIIFDKVAAGSNHSCGVTTEGLLYLWGASESGRLGFGLNQNENVKVPTELHSINQWLQKNEGEGIEIEVPEDQDEQNSLQSMLKNEPTDQYIEALLTQDQKIVGRLENVLLKFNQVRSIQDERENIMSYIESLIVSKIENIPFISNPDFKLTLPQIIAKNFQLYEFLLACMQTHPCYMAKIVENNPHLPKTEVGAAFKAIYGDMSNNPQKLRRLMLLYKLTLKISVSNTEFKKSLKVKTGDLSAYIYFYILNSQATSRNFYAALASEIMKLVYKFSNRVDKNPKKKVFKPEKFDKPEIQEENKQEPVEVLTNNPINENLIDGLEKHKIRDALNFKQLEELGELPPELKGIRDKRKALYMELAKKVKKKIHDILTHDPKIRKRVPLEQKISNEIKFMYKDIPNVYRERYKEQCNSADGKNMLDSKIVLLFFAPLVEILREPIRLKKINQSEFSKSLPDQNFDEFIGIYSKGLSIIADYIEELGEWKKNVEEPETKESKKKKSSSNKFAKQCKYRESLVKELTNVADLNLTDLSLGDMLSTSLEPEDSYLIITLEDLCNIHLLLKSNLEIIKTFFGGEDPVYIIIESLGKVKALFRKILSGDVKNLKLNLRLPIRWLLRERGLQSCKECKTPLTHSLLRKHPPEENLAPDEKAPPEENPLSEENSPSDKVYDIPLTVPTEWRCWSCGNTQDGWHMKCLECSALRRDFPEEALFKNFKQFYISDELSMFTDILNEIPPIPPKIPILNFILDFQDKQPSGSYLLQKLKIFVEKLSEIGNVELDQEDRAQANIERLEMEAEHEYNLRASHKAYLDSMNNMLTDIEDKIKLICLQFSQNTIVTLKQASAAVAKGKNVYEDISSNKRGPKKAQGRFSVDYLFKKKILDKLDLPESIRKNTSFYFTEVEDGAFDARIVLREDRNYLCLPREPIEVKILGFRISMNKLKDMRRTMNFRSQTSFENGKVTFNVFPFVRMLGSLLGKSKQGDF